MCPRFLSFLKTNSDKMRQEDTYAHEIYTKAALLSDNELVTLTGKNAASLQLTPYMSHGSKPGVESKFYIVSLHGMPQHTRDAVRKIKIFYRVSTTLQLNWLTPETQLSPKQARPTLEHLTDKYKTLSGGQVSEVSLPTLQELLGYNATM